MVYKIPVQVANWRRYAAPFFMGSMMLSAFASQEEHKSAWDQMNDARDRDQQKRNRHVQN